LTPESLVPAREPTAFDGWRSISLSLIMTLVGYGVMVGIPVISTAWVELLGFTEEQVGRVAGADLGGLSLGAIATAIIITRTNRKYLVLFGGGIAILANYLCIVFQQYEIVLWLRALSGFGSGIYTAVAVAALGATLKPTRAFNMMLFAFAISQALEMHILPQLSMNGVYWFFIACFSFTLLFVSWVPSYVVNNNGETVTSNAAEQRARIPAYIPWLCLTAIFVTYINIGAYWTYIELASLDAGVPGQWIGTVLVWASFLSIVGCAFATVISNRFGLVRPLVVALVTMAIIVGMLASGITNLNIVLSVFMFNFLWIFIDVYQMSTVAIIDPKGSFSALMPGAQGLGQIVGPNVAASLLGAQLGYSAVFIMCASAAIGGLLIYALMHWRLRIASPMLAETAGKYSAALP
jgi:predicted MFS family arabinose efflux permease